MFRLTLTVLALMAFVVMGCDRAAEPDPTQLAELFAKTTVEENAAAGPIGPPWTAAVAPRSFKFPADHAAHEDFRIEWWYYTGNLVATNGRRFGYQLTFFRTGIHRKPINPSRWAVRDLYTAHFAVSDLQNGRHRFAERNNRRGIGLAGAAADRFEVSNGNWQVWLEGNDHRLRAADDHGSIDLTLRPVKPPALHGDSGLSQKGPSEGNASYYYSLTLMATRGTLRFANEEFAVTGESWMDHEFSTSFLEPGQIGWDWFAIQLDDGVELMLYQMRREDGSPDPHSSGSLVNRAGEVTRLARTQYELRATRTWTSPATAATYPLEWRIQIPDKGYDLRVAAAFDGQEMVTTATTGICYWEGAVEVSGDRSGETVSGHGYLELTGYAGQGLGSLLE